MIIDIAKGDELIIIVSCEANGFNREKLDSFTASDKNTIDAFIQFQNSNICTYFNYDECMNMQINSQIDVLSRSTFYDVDVLPLEDKAIIDDFIILIKSKLI